MRVFNGFGDLPRFRNPVVTVGSYDGVHAGHRKLLQTIRDIARRTGGESVVVTFSPHPREVLAGGGTVKLLSSLGEKTLLLAGAGIDNLVVAPFTTEFSRISSYDFVKQYLIDRIGVHTLVVGYNHHFGHNKTGDFNYLERMGEEFGFGIYMVPRHDVDDDKVSSTIIRNLIGQGRVAEAAKYLGYRYFIMGAAGENGIFHPDDAAKLLPPAGEYPVEAGAECGPRQCGVLVVQTDGTLRLTAPDTPFPPGKATVTFM